MVQKTFGIYDNEVSGQYRLFIEVGKSHVACWTLTDTTNIIHNFELFEFKWENPTEFADIFRHIKIVSRLIDGAHVAAHIVWENEECLMIPDKYYDKQSADIYLNTIFGSRIHTQMHVRTLIDTVVVYRVYESWNTLLHNALPSASSIHKYGTLYNIPAIQQKYNMPYTYLRALVYRHHFVLTVVKGNKLQLLQSYVYQTPDDAIYYLLNVCEQYGLSPESTPVFIAGLLNTKASLYEDLNKYLGNISIDEVNDDCLSDLLKEHPRHYFSSFFKTLL